MFCTVFNLRCHPLEIIVHRRLYIELYALTIFMQKSMEQFFLGSCVFLRILILLTARVSIIRCVLHTFC